MSAIERRSEHHADFKVAKGRNKAERTNSVGDYDMLTSSQDAAMLRERIERSKYLSREQIYPSPNLSTSLGCFEEHSWSSGSGSTSSADGLSGDPLTGSSTESSVVRTHSHNHLKNNTHKPCHVALEAIETIETFTKAKSFEDTHSPHAGDMFIMSYQHGTCSSSFVPATSIGSGGISSRIGDYCTHVALK